MKRILLIVLLLGLTGAGIGYRMYNKPHEDLSKSKADVTITATQLLADYEANETEANTKYLEKTLEVTGTVAKIEKTAEANTIVLGQADAMSTVRCEMMDKSADFATQVKEG